MDEPLKFYMFREQRGWAGSQPVVGFALREIVERLFTSEEMSELFGGHLEYEDNKGVYRYRGVWGDRKVKRFLRMLRERGGSLEVEEASPQNFRQRWRVSSGKIHIPLKS